MNRSPNSSRESSRLIPSPGTPGEGKGGGFSRDARDNALDRREFLTNAARLATAAGLSVGCGVLVFRRASAKDCVRLLPCDDCHKFVSCELPKAQLTRQRVTRGDSTEGGSHA